MLTKTQFIYSYHKYKSPIFSYIQSTYSPYNLLNYHRIASG